MVVFAIIGLSLFPWSSKPFVQNYKDRNEPDKIIGKSVQTLLYDQFALPVILLPYTAERHAIIFVVGGNGTTAAAEA